MKLVVFKFTNSLLYCYMGGVRGHSTRILLSTVYLTSNIKNCVTSTVNYDVYDEIRIQTQENFFSRLYIVFFLIKIAYKKCYRQFSF